MSTIEERQKASFGSARLLLCKNCLIEQEVYSAEGHKENQMNLHCVRCGKFVTRMIKDGVGNWRLDTSVYK